MYSPDSTESLRHTVFDVFPIFLEVLEDGVRDGCSRCPVVSFFPLEEQVVFSG